MSPSLTRENPANAEQAATNFALVALSISVMAVVLGTAAIVVTSMTTILAIVTVIEVLGAFFFASRAAGFPQPESRARIARGLALLGLTLALVAIVVAVA
jgi:hypothetical protein